MQYPQPLLECALKLRHMPEFEPFRQYLEAAHQLARDNCEGLDGPALHRAQGRAKQLRELKELLEQAPSLLEKARKAPINK